MRTLFREMPVYLPAGRSETTVLVEGGRIADVGVPADTPADRIVSRPGCVVMPGVIDDQVHFREPGATHKEDLQSGSQAAAKGGVTTFFDMPNTNPPTTSPRRLREKIALATGRSVVNFAFYVGATTDNLDELLAVEAELADVTPGIKIFIGSSTGNLLVDEQAALEAIFARTTLPICAHCEDETTVRANRLRYADVPDVAVHSRVRDHEAAVVATRRAIDLAVRRRHRFHVLHVSTAEELPLIRAARPLVTAEVCPHHLLFSVEDYARLGTRVQMNPSVKTRDDNAALWHALRDGTVDIVATDHAPHTLEEKAATYPASPSGLPAVENSLALMLTEAAGGRCTPEQIVEWMAAGPARIWDMSAKGRIDPGADADLIVVDPGRRHVVRDAEQFTRCRWSPWDGVELTGQVVATFVRGVEVFADGRLTGAIAGRNANFVRERR